MVINEDFIGECVRITDSERDFVGVNVLFENYRKWMRIKNGEELTDSEVIKKGFHESFIEKMAKRGVRSKDIKMECGMMSYYHRMRLK